jgi:DHA2 family multidrug resistance protein
VPIGILAVFMILRFIEDPPYIKNAKVGRIDSIGLGLLALWLGALQLVLDKGQEEDWLASTWIRWGLAIAIVGLIVFLIRELIADHPLVDLSIFRNRNFAIGCFLIAAFGGVIYGIVTVLPLFYQTVLGYPANAAGIAVSPRGLGAIAIMPLVAALTGRMDNRWLMASGFVLFGVTALWMGNLTLDISQWSLIWPIILSGAGSGLVFVPLSVGAVGTLANEQIGNATGLYNLLRNVGGSIGISVVNSMVLRHQQIHRAELVRYFTPRPLFRQTLEKLQGLMAAHTGPWLAHRRAFALLNQQLLQQSAVYSYVDALRYFALVCFCCAPIVFILRRVKAKPGGAIAH